MTPGLWTMYAPEMKAMRRWFALLADTIGAFDWKRVSEQIEHARVRDAVSKTLDTH
jgi:hypothetical protein